jgi:hypothetical protein
MLGGDILLMGTFTGYLMAAVLGSLVFGSPAARADEVFSGNNMLPACERALVSDEPATLPLACFAIVKTVMLLTSSLSPQYRSCPPSTATVEQAVRMTVKLMHDRPDALDTDLAVIAEAAMQRAWPCGK